MMVKDMTETERAYMAGIIDGEGSIILRSLKAKSKFSDKEWTYYRLEVRVGNTDADLMEWLGQFGGRFYMNRPKVGSVKALYQWYVMTVDAARLLEQILPYMIIKAKKAKAAIFFQSRRKQPRQKSESEWSIGKIVDEALHHVISPGAKETGRSI